MERIINFFTKIGKVSVVLIYCMIMLLHNVAYCEEDKYEYVKNEYGKKLGMVYILGENKNISGELAIDKKTRKMLFISCDKTKVLDNEFYMRRDTRNCPYGFSYWPSDLLNYVSSAQGSTVILSGPSTSCGVCTEVPFSYFPIPNGVKIDPKILDNPLKDYPSKIKELLRNYPYNYNINELHRRRINDVESILRRDINSGGILNNGGFSSGGGAPLGN